VRLMSRTVRLLVALLAAAILVSACAAGPLSPVQSPPPVAKRERPLDDYNDRLLDALAGVMGKPDLPSHERVVVVASPKVELLFVVAGLASDWQLLGSRDPDSISLTRSAISYFGNLPRHPAVTHLGQLRKTGFWYDALPKLALTFSDPPALEQVYPICDYLRGRSRQGEPDLRDFMTRLRALAAEGDWETWWDEHEADYAKVEEHCRQVYLQLDPLGRLERYFGEHLDALVIIPSAMIAGGFGGTINDPLGSWAINCFGPARPEALPDASYLESIVLHEGGHAFVNHHADEHRELVTSLEHLYTPIASEMQKQAYGNWTTALNEHVLRACNIRMCLEREGEAAAEYWLAQEEGIGFRYIRPLYEKLADYEADRERYPDFGSFYEELLFALQPGQQSSKPTRAADLAWLAEQLPKLHPDLFFQVDETEYRQAIDGLRSSAASLDDAQYFVALARIVASVADDHTTLDLPAGEQDSYGSYPIGLYFFPEGLYVTRADESIEEFVGYRLVAIEDKPVEEVVARVATLVPKVNDSLVLFKAPVLMVRPEVLYGLGLASSTKSATFVFAGPAGKEVRLELKAARSSEITWSAGSWSAPEWLWHSRNIWHTYLEDDKTLFIQYYSSQGDLSKETAEIVKLLDSKPVERIVFDMRRNAGGAPDLARPLIEILAARPEVRTPGHLFVIVGRRTYSSTIPNCYDFLEKTNAVFFGEPTGGRPGGFGLVKKALLPSSGFTVQYSTSRLEGPDGSLTSFAPDHIVEQTAGDFAAGRDTVLEAILRYTGPE